MAEMTTLDALQAFHRELVALRERIHSAPEVLDNAVLVQIFEGELQKIWAPPARNDKSRAEVKSGKLTLDGDVYSINEDFQQNVLLLADEVEINELDAAKYLFDSQGDVSILGRSLLECGIIRFHQQRKHVLDSVRLLLELISVDDEDEEHESLEDIQIYVAERLFLPGSERLVPRCVSAMVRVRVWLQNIGEKLAAAQTLGQMSEEVETVEFSRASLLQQHELLAVILARAIEKRQGNSEDFASFIANLRRADKYDTLLVHQMPALGSFISVFGSTEGEYDLIRARETNTKLFPPDEASWPLQFLHAAVRSWWLAEYSGFYLDDPPESAIPPNTDLDAEDRERSKQFLDALKDGAFDFLLAVAGDVRPPDWHDPVRAGMRKWLQRKSPPLATEAVQFSEFFQLSLMGHLEVFVDAFISNLPDVLRKLRVEEDEQRQLSQTHEQDLDLERFLLIIAYAYEGRPEAATSFWSDPDSNLAGFMHWASRRASTPLVASFCEMLQAISGNDDSATSAHVFLLDEGHHSSGKMNRSQSLTWSQIFKELDFFSEKVKQKPAAANTARYRSGKPPTDFVETEPESAMMLECYLRLITKLATESETSRQYLVLSEYNLVQSLLDLASSPIPPRLRGCIFMVLKAMVTRKTLEESHVMWNYLETWIAGGFAGSNAGQQRPTQQHIISSVDHIMDEISTGFEDPQSFVQLLLSLIAPGTDSRALNDALPFPENLGVAIRAPGVELYVDFVIGRVFSTKSNDLPDINQLRVLRLSCLDFILICLATFNEDLIVLANETNLMIDTIITTTDLATYVKLHPFARVMEWMFNDKVMAALFHTIQQKAEEVGNAPPDSPLVLGILRAVEVITKVLDLQSTYLNVVRPIMKAQSTQRRQNVANAAYATFEDGLATRINLVVKLGSFCGLGHPELSLACLKLLEMMSSSPKITTAWSGSSRHAHRNKAIVAMEANNEHDVISRTFVGELMAPLDPGRESNTPNYATKVYILDFLYECLQATPKKPTIAHLLLGFKCDSDSLTIEANGAFAAQNSLFHSLLRLLLETPSNDAQGMRDWLISIKSRVIRILHILWSSPLSSALVIEELRGNEFLFHLLLREAVISSDLPWDGQSLLAADFSRTDGAVALLDFLILRSYTFEYIAMELCMISQGRMPGVKRRIFEALNGQVTGDGNEVMKTPTIFELYDFLLPDGLWDIPVPELRFYRDIELSTCLESDVDSNEVFNLGRVKEIMQLKRVEASGPGAVIAAQDVAAIDLEESAIVEYLISSNRQKQIATQGLKVLKTWARLLLVMVESNEFKGTAQSKFFLEALQAILPTLEAFASDRPDEALELARLAKVLLFKLNHAAANGGDDKGQDTGHLVSEKLYQLFQICLQAIGKWAGTPVLRSVYYEICYRYLTSMSDHGPLSGSRPKTIKTIQVYGERLINVICDDAYCGEPACQTSALILLSALIALEREEGGTHVVEALNKLNFVGILVDSLRDIMREWHEVFASGNNDQKNHQNARLALLLQLCQSRAGAKYVLHSNLFRALDAAGLFTADPELQATAQNPRALEQHYDLLAKVVRIIGAALVSRGSHNVVQGRRFLTEHRMLVTHTLKRSAGIGAEGGDLLEERVADLADALMVIIASTDFLEFEDKAIVPEPQPQGRTVFH